MDVMDSDAGVNTFNLLKRKSKETPARIGGCFVRKGEFDTFKKKVKDRLHLDLMVAAKNHEEMDTEANRCNLHKIILGGVDIQGMDSKQGEEWIKMMKDAAKGVLMKINPDTPEPAFFWHLNRHLKALKQILEVHLDSDQIKIRGLEQGVETSKADPGRIQGCLHKSKLYSCNKGQSGDPESMRKGNQG